MLSFDILLKHLIEIWQSFLIGKSHPIQFNTALDSVVGVDEEGRSLQRILTLAARKYASTIERNLEDYDALYNWILVL